MNGTKSQETDQLANQNMKLADGCCIQSVSQWVKDSGNSFCSFNLIWSWEHTVKRFARHESLIFGYNFSFILFKAILLIGIVTTCWWWSAVSHMYASCMYLILYPFLPLHFPVFGYTSSSCIITLIAVPWKGLSISDLPGFMTSLYLTRQHSLVAKEATRTSGRRFIFTSDAHVYREIVFVVEQLQEFVRKIRVQFPKE